MKSHFFAKIRANFWYLPCLFGLFAIILAVLSVKADTLLRKNETLLDILPSFLLSDIDLAQTILSSISASLLTMTTITFSTILVVLTTYLSQFSPRTLQNFITDHSTQRVLGIFVGGFIYSILLLLFLREDNSQSLFIVPTFAVLMAILCLFVFVFFINHVSSWIQVSNLIHDITVKTVASIEKDFKDKTDVTLDSPWEDWESGELNHISPISITMPTSGYIQYIDVDGLVKQASMDDCIIRIEKKLGDYVDEETPLLTIWKMGTNDVTVKYEKYITLGSQKAPIGDIQFGLTKLVEIALRALSPGINDPNTAINSIEQLGKILARLGKKHLPRPYHNDHERNLRIILERPTYSDYVYMSFYQIRQYGSSDISVVAAMIKSLTHIAESNTKEIKDVVWEFTLYIIEGADHGSLLSLDRKFLNSKLESLAKATGHTEDFHKLKFITYS